MQIKAVLFDLDGTLLPMNMDEFVKTYFGLLSKRMAQFGYDPKELIATIWSGTKAMMKNDGSVPNEKVFWQAFADKYGDAYFIDQKKFDEFYDNEFLNVKSICGFNPLAKEAVDRIKSAGMRVVLATQPIFPSIATVHRTAWAGLDVNDFEMFTAYENIGYCKPNPEYYKEILSRIGLLPEECLMVGNDVDDDMIAETIGMNVFLLTDCLVNQSGKEIADYPHGDFNALMEYLNV